MRPSEYLSHFRLQDIGEAMFQQLDQMTKLENPNQRVPSILMLSLIALDALEGSPESALAKAVKALNHAKLQEGEHYRAIRDYIAQELQ